MSELLLNQSGSLLDKIKGGLFGVAAGDALGGTTEFMSVAQVKATYGFLTEIIGGGVWGLAPGEVTDDTMMTLCVAEGILENPAEPMGTIGRLFREWYAGGPKDVGNIIRQVLERYEGNWYEAAFVAHLDLGQSAGNGSLMRCLPAALAYASLEQVEQVSRLQSRMTHYDERCDEACILYNRMAWRLLQGEELKEVVRQVVAGTDYAVGLGTEPLCSPSGFVVDTFRWVLYLLLDSASFAKTIQRAANLGGDSDTIGAIAGGLAGLYYGYAAIPGEYREAILIKGRLSAAAEALYLLRQGGAGVEGAGV
ncbi:ADP-ribosylglycohydrolase family protein [Paenibacillus mesotrionivorans]|uniref:ADP-ribosylglycohydrolase family protein n=1 Tax=Paenibacillus mesotrionivorans TaxID=3160968 RepID=A0ACC7P4G2_9BACL